ncbi:hypothetical protein RFI_23030, partial [Reticulomyxa filosa]
NDDNNDNGDLPPSPQQRHYRRQTFASNSKSKSTSMSHHQRLTLDSPPNVVYKGRTHKRDTKTQPKIEMSDNDLQQQQQQRQQESSQSHHERINSISEQHKHKYRNSAETTTITLTETPTPTPITTHKHHSIIPNKELLQLQQHSQLYLTSGDENETPIKKLTTPDFVIRADLRDKNATSDDNIETIDALPGLKLALNENQANGGDFLSVQTPKMAFPKLAHVNETENESDMNETQATKKSNIDWSTSQTPILRYSLNEEDKNFPKTQWKQKHDKKKEKPQKHSELTAEEQLVRLLESCKLEQLNQRFQRYCTPPSKILAGEDLDNCLRDLLMEAVTRPFNFQPTLPRSTEAKKPDTENNNSKSTNSSDQSQSPSTITLTLDGGEEGRPPVDDNSFEHRDEEDDNADDNGNDDDDDSDEVLQKLTRTTSVDTTNNATRIKTQMAYKVASLDTYERTVESSLMRLHQILQYSLKHNSLTEEQFAKLSDIIREYLQKKYGVEISSKNPQLTMPIRRMSVHKDQINNFSCNFSCDDFMAPLDLDNIDPNTPNQVENHPHLPKVIGTLDCNVIELGKSLATKNKTELKTIWNDFYIKQYSAKEKTDFEIKNWIPYYDVKHFVYHLVQLHMDEQLRAESIRHASENGNGVIDVWNKEDVGETARQILKIIDSEEGGTHVSLKRNYKTDGFENKPVTADQSPIRSELHGIMAYTFEQFLRLGQILREQEEVDNEDSNEFDDFQIDFQDFCHFLSDKQDDIIQNISKHVTQNGEISLEIVEQTLDQALMSYCKKQIKDPYVSHHKKAIDHCGEVLFQLLKNTCAHSHNHIAQTEFLRFLQGLPTYDNQIGMESCHISSLIVFFPVFVFSLLLLLLVVGYVLYRVSFSQFFGVKKNKNQSYIFFPKLWFKAYYFNPKNLMKTNSQNFICITFFLKTYLFFLLKLKRYFRACSLEIKVLKKKKMDMEKRLTGNKIIIS